MYNYVPYLSFLTSGIGILFILYLLFRFYQFQKAYWLMGIIFSVVYMEFYIYALTSKHIYQMLFLFRSSNILRAFLPVLLFFYVKGMLKPNKPIQPLEWLHFIFPIIVTIGIMPDLLLPDAEKIKILDGYYKENSFLLLRKAGMIPPGTVQPASIAVGIIYGLLSIGQIFYAQKKFGSSFVYYNKQNLTWLKLLSLVITLYFLLQLYQYLNLFMNHTFNPPSQIIKCIIGILLFSYFIGTPNVQENMDGCILPPSKKQHDFVPSVEDILPKILTSSDNNFPKNFEQKIKESACYLHHNCDLQTVAKIVDLTPQKLSAQIKKMYGMSFVEYINRLKIYHFLSQCKHSDHYTLETYIYESGFKNRSTFYAAFKKYIGINPSFYLKEIGKNQH